MAMESACKLRVGRDLSDGKVRMDGDFIDFAGATKFRFRLAEIHNPRLEGDAIRFGFHGTDISIILDPKTATRWITAILNPESLADKLDVKSGHAIRILNLDDVELMESLRDKKVKLVSSAPARCDMVMLGVERASELRQIGELSESLRPGGAIWVVLPKSIRTVTKANVITAARDAGLNNIKAVDYSETLAAYKITRPADAKKRRKAAGNGAAAEDKPAATTARRGSKRSTVKAGS